MAPVARAAGRVAEHVPVRSLMREIEMLAHDTPKTAEYSMLMNSVRNNPTHGNLTGVRNRLRAIANTPSQLVQDIPIVHETMPDVPMSDMTVNFDEIGRRPDFVAEGAIPENQTSHSFDLSGRRTSYTYRNTNPMTGDTPLIGEARDRLAGIVYRENADRPLNIDSETRERISSALTDRVSLTELQELTEELLANSEIDHTVDGVAPLSIFERPEARGVLDRERGSRLNFEALSESEARRIKGREERREKGIRGSIEKIKNREGKPPSPEELREVQPGRPWPDFIGEWIPLDVENTSGRKTMMSKGGMIQSVPDEASQEWPIVVGQLGVHPTFPYDPDATFASYTHLGPDLANYGNMKEYIREHPEDYAKIRSAGKNVIREAMKKQAEVRGNLYSDVAGRNSPYALKALEAEVPEETGVKVYQTGGIPAHKIEHTRGGNIRGIVDKLREQGKDIPEEKVQEYLKKYGGSAILGGAALSGWLAERKKRKEEETPTGGEE
jgi:hypothetical protein